MKRVQSSKGTLFQSSAAVMKVSTMPPRNSDQKVRLCQLPGAGVGQMRNGGAKRVRASRRSRVSPAIRPDAKTIIVMHWEKPESFCRFTTAVDVFAKGPGALRSFGYIRRL